VLVLEAVVLLVHTDDVFELDWFSLGVCAVAVKVLDMSETVAAEAELVCGDTKADITNVEGLFAVEWRARV
jgi:hypothetical protein